MLFGPASRVAAVGRRGHLTRTIASGPRHGANFSVSVSTHVAALVEYAGGEVASVLFSFDSPLTRHGFLEITGSEATLAVPSPSKFGGELQIRKPDSSEWTVLPATGSVAGRGTGVLDMVRALTAGEPHRASGEIGLHVLETMVSIDRSASTGRFEPVGSSFTASESSTS
jgi:predicted dehydrogenase